MTVTPYVDMYNMDFIQFHSRKDNTEKKKSESSNFTCNGPSNKFIFRATYGNSIVCNIFPAYKMTQETSDILTK
jgi:hypothetical protein